MRRKEGARRRRESLSHAVHCSPDPATKHADQPMQEPSGGSKLPAGQLAAAAAAAAQYLPPPPQQQLHLPPLFASAPAAMGMPLLGQAPREGEPAGPPVVLPTPRASLQAQAQPPLLGQQHHHQHHQPMAVGSPGSVRLCQVSTNNTRGLICRQHGGGVHAGRGDARRAASRERERAPLAQSAPVLVTVAPCPPAPRGVLRGEADPWGAPTAPLVTHTRSHTHN
jgi:hypothetical protein